MFRPLAALLFAATFGFTATPNGAQASGIPGKFDFYVLALSWAPSFCKSPAARPGSPECTAGGRRGAPHAFVVHGLWPQYERGFPQFCADADRPDRKEADSIADLMPDPRLIGHEWRAHGSCSGLTPPAYLGAIRKARAKVAVPPALRNPAPHFKMSVREIETAFVRANPGLAPAGIAVACDGRRLEEVRICMTRDLGFRTCEEVDRRGCRPDRILAIPPVR